MSLGWHRTDFSCVRGKISYVALARQSSHEPRSAVLVCFPLRGRSKPDCDGFAEFQQWRSHWEPSQSIGLDEQLALIRRR